MAILIGEGKIDCRERVADYIPEFGTNGKDVITVEQVMLHTSGFPHAPLDPPDWDDREARLAALRAVAAATGSRARASSTTRPPRTGCSPS